MISQIEHIAIYVASFAVLLFLLERAFPLRTPRYALIGRLAINIVLSGLTFLVAFVFVRPVVHSLLPHSDTIGIGLLNLFDFNKTVRVIVSFLLLDLSFYYWHLANHRISFLWRFHNVHHFDGDLDVSTGARFHPVEVFFSAAFRVLQILLLGVTLGEYLAYEFFFQLATFFHHSNLRLPAKIDALLSTCLVTPRIHGIHHSRFQNETNSNYGVIFSFWDRLHRSFNYHILPEKLTIGVPGYPHERFGSIISSLTAPFLRQNQYWQDEDGVEFFSRSSSEARIDSEKE